MRETLCRDDGAIIHTLAPDKCDVATEWRLIYYPPGMRMKTHRHDVAQFSVLLAGQARETTRQGTFDSRPLLMEYKPADFCHANEFGADGALQLSININPDTYCLREYFAVQEWRLKYGADMRKEWTLLANKIARSKNASEDEMEMITADLLTALVKSDDRRADLRPPRWLVRAREAIIETDKSTETIAADAGVHRVHLSRSFSRHFGQSISATRREARLARALRLLVHHGDRAGAASHAAGFSDQSHLTRSLRAACGLTPGALRSVFNG